MSKTTPEPIAEPVEATDAPMGSAHEPPATGTELIKRVPLPPAVGPYVLSDDEIRRTWRLASALAASGMFKDAKQAEIAFGKILLGQDLGVSPTQALMTIDIVKGNVQLRGVLLASFVRRSPHYDYRIVSLDGETVDETGKTDEAKEAAQHCTLRFYAIHPNGEREALVPDITYTMVMARRTGNVKPESAWMTARRNMLLWRAMSDGVKFHCPELLGGIPVYVEGEIGEQKQIGDGQGDGQPAGLDLGPDVDKIIARAEELGHAALADRATIEMVLGDQPPAKVQEWVKAANRELDEMPQDAEVVPDAAPDLSGTENDGTPPSLADAERIEALRNRALGLLADADALRVEGNDEQADEAQEEAELLMTQVDAASDPAQGELL